MRVAWHWLYHTIPYHTVPYRTVPHRAATCHAIADQTRPNEIYPHKYVVSASTDGSGNAGALLRAAAIAGNYLLVDQLLQAGVSPFESTVTAKTALHFAAEHGHVDVVRRLLQHKDCAGHGMVPDVAGQRPFDLAIRGGHVEVRRVIVPGGIEKNMTTRARMGSTLLCAAHDCRKADVEAASPSAPPLVDEDDPLVNPYL